jgi:hypothetical protein
VPELEARKARVSRAGWQHVAIHVPSAISRGTRFSSDVRTSQLTTHGVLPPRIGRAHRRSGSFEGRLSSRDGATYAHCEQPCMRSDAPRLKDARELAGHASPDEVRRSRMTREPPAPAARTPTADVAWRPRVWAAGRYGMRRGSSLPSALLLGSGALCPVMSRIARAGRESEGVLIGRRTANSTRGLETSTEGLPRS